MKKMFVSVMVLLAMVFSTSIGLAAEGGKNPQPSKESKLPPPATPTCAVTMIGKIVSIDKEKNAVVINDQADKQDKTIYLPHERIQTLKKGQTIKFELTAPATTDSVSVVRIPVKSKGPSSYGEGEQPVSGSKRTNKQVQPSMQDTGAPQNQ